MRSFLSLLTVVLMTWSAACFAAAASEAELAAVQQEARRGGYRLMALDQLWEKYRDGETDLLIIDTREDWEYRTGSIEGAVHFFMESSWISRLIQRGALAQALGPNKERVLVFY